MLSLDIISAQSLLMASNSKVKVGKEGNSASSAFNIEQNIASESVVPTGWYFSFPFLALPMVGISNIFSLENLGTWKSKN